jgi:hypothetical protein
MTRTLTMPEQVAAGDWIEVEFVVMDPEQRVVSAADTAQLPLLGRVRGFAVGSSRVGADAEVETLCGRHQSGTVVDAEPGHHHSFGQTNTLVLMSGLRAKRSLSR